MDDDYEYWLDGSLKKDKNKKISITYNYLKLPDIITFDNGRTISTEYDAEGTKLKKIDSNGETTDYEEDEIYVNNALYQTSHDEGRINAQGKYEYNITDHNNDLRVSFRDSSGVAVPVQSIFYDPWGLSMKGMQITRNPLNFNRYQFLSREIQIETGLVDLINRQYDPQRGQFLSQDPIIEGQEHLSLYQYGWNNPVLKPDPDGLEPCCGELIEFTTGFNAAVVQDFSILPISVVNTQKDGAYAKGATAGHVAAVVLGAIETILGAGGDLLAGTGEVASAGLASPVALPAAALSTAGIVQGVSAVGKGISSLRSEGKSSSENQNTGRGGNHLKPDNTAKGDHSTFRTDSKTGKTTNTATYKQNPKNPSGFDETKRVDVTGGSHKNSKTKAEIPTPHVHEPKQKDPRPARKDELPRQ